MSFITKTNALFLFCAGIFFLLFTYFVMEPVAINNSSVNQLARDMANSLLVYIKFFYALGFFIMFFGIFLFFISGLYPENKAI